MGQRIGSLLYGMVELPEGKNEEPWKERGDADDLMEAMIETAKETSAELGKLDGLSKEEADDIARIVGLGALKYFILKVDARKNMTFNPKDPLISMAIQDLSSNILMPVSGRCCVKQPNQVSLFPK